MTTAQLPVGWNILLNAGAWLVIHLGASFVTSRISLSSFDPEAWLYRTRSWERGGGVYQRLFTIRGWKRMLPDGAAAFRSGFRKKRMTGRSPRYCRTFAQETCRAELSHWLVLAIAPLFFLWDPWWIAWPMVPYAVAVNAPCIAAQRYNRPRLIAFAAHSGSM